MLYKYKLEVFVWKSQTKFHWAIVDMIFGPQPKSGLHKRQSRIGIIPFSKPCIELQHEVFPFLVGPIWKSGLLFLTDRRRFTIIRQSPDERGNTRWLADIGVVPS